MKDVVERKHCQDDHGFHGQGHVDSRCLPVPLRPAHQSQARKNNQAADGGALDALDAAAPVVDDRPLVAHHPVAHPHIAKLQGFFVVSSPTCLQKPVQLALLASELAELSSPRC